MSNLQRITSLLKKDSLTKTPLLAFCFSLSCELLLVLYLFFFFLWTTEIVLPGFISLRINLAPYFATLLGVTFLLMYIGQLANYQFSKTFPFEKTLLSLILFWGIGTITISLIKFPWWAILSLLVSFVVIVVYFWRILLEDRS